MDIYPAIDLKDGKCVRLIQGDFAQVTTYGDDPVAMAQKWQDEGARWLHVVDLDGARTGNSSDANVAAIRGIVDATGLPVQVGGGIRNVNVAERILGLGVARVVVGTTAAQNPELTQQLLTHFGNNVAIGVDAREGKVAIHGWQEHSGETATDFVTRLADMGASRFIFTDIGRDGMLQGVNLDSLTQVAQAIPNIPVIASGGVAIIADIEALGTLQSHSAPNIDGVIIGKALYAGTVSLAHALAKAS